MEKLKMITKHMEADIEENLIYEPLTTTQTGNPKKKQSVKQYENLSLKTTQITQVMMEEMEDLRKRANQHD
ncbi:hypothetical protein Bca101_002585 [Brassica carinata]